MPWRCNAGMTMRLRSTQPLPGPAAAMAVLPRAGRGAGPGLYQESTLELWRGSRVMPLALSALPGELLLEFERQSGTWRIGWPPQART